MKTSKTIPLLGLLALLTILLGHAPRAAAQPGTSISFRTFYEELSPYGGWITHPAYGSVWVPDAGPGFQPYGTDGYWVMTEYGNTWVSEYAWGWAPFHYGRWFYDDYYGWAWVPGHEWGPAWVAWRSGGGYYGWAPLGPGVNLQVNIVIPARHWVFVPQRYITYRQPYRYCAPRHQVVNIYHNSVHIHNTYRNDNRVYVYGPDRDDIARATRREVPVYRVEEAQRPGRTAARDGAVEVYRPRVTPEGPGNTRPARGDTYANDRESREYESPRSGRAYGAPGSRRPSEGNAPPYPDGRAGRSVPAGPESPRGRVVEEGYRESRSYPGADAPRESNYPRQEARPQRAPEERGTDFPVRSPRETGTYGPSREEERARRQAPPEASPRNGPQAPPEPSGRGRVQAQPDPSTRGAQQRPARQPASPGEPAGQRESAGYSRPRRG
jgi:hypothetical protein